MKNRKVILILGPHRSGTSALAGTLSQAGLRFSSDLLPPSEFNEKGYYEDSEIVDLNEKLLLKMGGNWHSPLPILKSQSQPSKYLEKAEQLLSDRLEEENHICFKDPRFSILFPFWQRVIREMSEVELLPIINLRKPDYTINSLIKRNNFSKEKSAFITSAYMIASERNTRECRRHFVFLDDLIKSPERILTELEAFIGIELRRDVDFVDKGLLKANSKMELAVGKYSDLAHQVYVSLKEQIETSFLDNTWEQLISIKKSDFVMQNEKINLRVILKGLIILLKNPTNAISKLSFKNLRILFKALKEENKSSILQNLKNLMKQ